ncbi:MAG: hypothetical protein U9N53_06525 [Bacteroidota bacterium]|nr:hypothetical protein [Bacteroidota bacterium]
MLANLKPEKQSISIVLVGDFNPKIFHPIWFSGQGLIREKEAENSSLNIVHPEIVNFSLDWCKFEVTRERFVISTSQESSYEPLRDLALGTFNILLHTPLTMLGINTEMHFKMGSTDEWHAFGHKVAPKDIWEKELENAGTISVTIEGARPEGLDGYIHVETKPSPYVQPGIYFRINDHFQVKNIESSIGSTEIINILGKEWFNSRERAENIISNALENK